MSGAYKAGGKVHRILDRLNVGPTSRADLAEIIRGPHQTSRRAQTRFYRLSVFLRDEGLVWATAGELSITARGVEALDELGPLITTGAHSVHHQTHGAPNARIFARKEAA